MKTLHLIASYYKLLIAAALAVIGLILWFSGSLQGLSEIFSREYLQAVAIGMGSWGPTIIVVSMIAAVIASPIPSAPIAMASGALYGHFLGSIYVIAGAEIGALIAFSLARFFGRDVVKRWFGDSVDAGLLGSQNALTAVVFFSRLMPFISFDLMSYAAGLSVLHLWRFALATLAGIIPAGILLAHFGETAIEGGGGNWTWAVLGLGLITGAPLIWVALKRR